MRYRHGIKRFPTKIFILVWRLFTNQEQMSIKAKDISKIYGQQKALNQVSFKISKGEIVGFLGPNGSGKSTMMKIITGFIPATSGQIFVNGLDVGQKTKEVQKIIGYLPENNPLYPELYVKEFLEFSGRVYGIRKNLNQRIAQIIEMLGLGDEQHKKIGTLSKGYRQRVGLAQALIHEPEILILDEPTTGLDPNQIIEIRELIAHLGKEKTVMLSTHIMQEVEAICSRVIIIKKGQIIADDTAGAIQKNQSNQIISIEFNKILNEKLWDTFKNLKEIRKIGKTQWVLSFDTEIDMREKLFQFAVANNLAVLSLQKKDKSLEEVFRELTK